MVSFTCSSCQDVVKKPKVNSHATACGSCFFTCVDCMEMFDLQTIKGHTSCVTETEKYQGKWRKRIDTARGINDINGNNNNNNNNASKGCCRLYPRRPPLNFGSDSDDDDTWVTAKKSKKNVNSAALISSNTAAKIITANTQDKCEEELDGPPQKRIKLLSSPSKKDEKKGGDMREQKQDWPQRPQEAVVTDCVVPSFVLGSDEEVASVARSVLAEEEQEKGVSSLSMKKLSKKIVERYNSCIAKHVQNAIKTVIQNGKLQEKDGVVTYLDYIIN